MVLLYLVTSNALCYFLVDMNKTSFNAELTYEERAALRKAEREKRKREREALAGAK